MRFLPGGPSIPDTLLASRDEGQVVFFCGAGVSRARANLHDFAGLATAVADALGSSRGSPARKLLALATSPAARIDGIGGLLPTDRVFSLLEREFEVEDVRNAVARALRYRGAVDRSAHRILLDLARGPDGAVRLVTTNFDRLFEEEDPNARVYYPPMLPRPNRPQEWAGIINLHGRLGDGFTAPPLDQEFVLSSTDFGRAYLSDGWATDFIRGLMEPFQLVFVGYAADDPPVQYLLEALNGSSEGRLFAFQAGQPDTARALWSSKGVEAIAYALDSGHQALWATLEAWAERARSPEAWRTKLLDRAMQGPAALEPHERGQIKHLVSSSAGAQRFLEAAPPASWLGVFDPALRYREPVRDHEGGILWDPFEDFGLDDDTPPVRGPDAARGAPRSNPPPAWSAFRAHAADRDSIGERGIAALSGPGATTQTVLPPRLGRLSTWINRVADDPVTPWWAAATGGLHPDVIGGLRFQRQGRPASEAVRRAWSLIATAHEQARSEFDMRWYEFVEDVKRNGWSEPALLRWSDLLAPRVTVSGVRGQPPTDPNNGEPLTSREMVDADVLYPKAHDHPPIPETLLPFAASLVRRQIQDALHLERYAREWIFLNLAPIRPDPALDGDGFSRTHGLSRLIFRYVDLLKALVGVDPAAAMAEAGAWPSDEVFDRLRLWAMGDWAVWPAADLARRVRDMAGAHLWSMHGQRDLLLTLKARWPDLSATARRDIVRRLSQGPDDRDSDAGEAARRERRAHLALNVLGWLANAGCDLGPTYPALKTRLKRDAPNWQEVWAEQAAESLEGQIGWVGSDEDMTILEGVPLRQILGRAAEAGGRDWRSMTERRPFKGLVDRHRAKAFKALMLSAAAGEHPDWAWDAFFWPDDRRTDPPRLRAVIGERLARLPAPVLQAHVRAVTHWMQGASEGLSARSPDWFGGLWSRVLEVLGADPDLGASSVSGGSGRLDWVTRALNSPGGDLAMSLMNMETRVDEAAGTFEPQWLARADALLSIGGEAARLASVILLRNLAWFNHWAGDWTAHRLLALLDGDETDQDAFWDGVLSSATPPPGPLFDRLRPAMIALAARQPDHDQAERLAGFLLNGWGSRRPDRTRYVSDEDMRELLIVAGDDFRSSVLATLDRWSAKSADWKRRLRIFLSRVWPRQRVAKTPKLSSRLFDLAVDSERRFDAMVDLVVPLMTTVDSDTLFLFKVNERKTWVERHPAALLKLVYAALPRDASLWPYGADEMVNRLAAQPAVAVDSRMIELRRRLAAR